MVEVNIECDSGETPPLRAKGAFHSIDPWMRIGKAINRAVIVQTGKHRARQAIQIDTTRKIPQQITDGGLECRLR